MASMGIGTPLLNGTVYTGEAWCDLEAQTFPPAPQQHPQSLSELRPEPARSLFLPATCGPGEDHKSSDSASPPRSHRPPWPRAVGTETVGITKLGFQYQILFPIL
ncbi:hypothetical protein H671_5g15114 [Cricetulus griseus]|nr:hypothetical protein H671_5g15114 [Cricetulus griseus]